MGFFPPHSAMKARWDIVGNLVGGWVGGRAGGVDTRICECNNLRTTQHSSIKLAPLVHLLKSHTSLNLTDLSLKVKVRGQALT